MRACSFFKMEERGELREGTRVCNEGVFYWSFCKRGCELGKENRS